jgi:hypothetical protein
MGAFEPSTWRRPVLAKLHPGDLLRTRPPTWHLAMDLALGGRWLPGGTVTGPAKLQRRGV